MSIQDELGEATRRAFPKAAEMTMRELYAANPLLRLMLDNAAADPNSEMLAACRNAGYVPTPQEQNLSSIYQRSTALRALWEKDMQEKVVTDTQAELRPPVEQADKPLHWVQDGDDAPEIAFWETADAPTWTPEGARCMWRLHDETQQYAPDAPQLSGYRYLGPAEWLTADGCTKDQALTAAAEYRDQLQAEIARLRTENTALRTERDYEPARLAEWRDAGRAGFLPTPRAHDFGVPPIENQVRAALVPAAVPGTLGDLMGRDPPAPTDEVHEAVERVIGHIADGKVTPTGRTALRGALDKAEAPATRRAASDAAIGRIAGMR